MAKTLGDSEIRQAFLDACAAELSALKPGNVHRHAAGHRMEVEHFERAAAAAAPHIADSRLTVGQRILNATEASVAATGVNVNLGIVLLAAPLAKAAAEIDVGMGLRRRLAVILSLLDEADARDAFAAIRLANPAGLGDADEGDVRGEADMTLTKAMHLAADRDRIAKAYVTAYEDIFDFALPCLAEAQVVAASPDLAITTLHLALLAEYPDSHIARKHGLDVADAVRRQAQSLAALWRPVATPESHRGLMAFDSDLKARGLNPGTTADLVVATLFASLISGRKQP
ncbi:MAG: triphosphoribosyl-dephospho-CoA synthase [Hyphomicrobium sp.]